MNVVLVGAAGQLGEALRRLVPDAANLVSLSRADLDIGDEVQVQHTIERLRPDLVINAAAYTQVDQAEADQGSAFRINAQGPEFLATAALAVGARLIHVSTDFVFSGEEASPYEVDAETSPLNVYGRSKLAGEQAVRAILADRAVILRTSWLYARAGRNFVLTMLRLMASRDSLGVVIDQIGSPTWADSLANAVWAIAQNTAVHGRQHWCDSGVASWYDFAVAIQDEALKRRLLRQAIPIRPILTRDYPTPAIRPRYSVLDTGHTSQALGFAPPHWRHNLEKMLDGLAAA